MNNIHHPTKEHVADIIAKCIGHEWMLTEEGEILLVEKKHGALITMSPVCFVCGFTICWICFSDGYGIETCQKVLLDNIEEKRRV